jgi:hypothetical protein
MWQQQQLHLVRLVMVCDQLHVPARAKQMSGLLAMPPAAAAAGSATH